ncbi:MAG: DUF3343 domain-containing protein [Deltaproteobacteria bacterium]|nr:DUF3343 domain-containing protein [Deltaproteobacteria bacterium]
MSYILTFGSTHTVLKAEEVLKEKGVAFRLDPAPKSLTEGCELVITAEEGNLKELIKVLGNACISPVSIYERSGDKLKKAEGNYGA